CFLMFPMLARAQTRPTISAEDLDPSIRLTKHFALVPAFWKALPGFFFSDPEPMSDPVCPLASKDKEKTVKVVIVTKASIKAYLAYRPMEQEFSVLLSQAMQTGFKNNHEKVTIVENSAVQAYKGEHREWRAESAAEFGKHFNADYVIAVE